jgi:fatty-acid peroxygenase
MTTDIPRDPAFDSTLAILHDGYEYIWKRCQRLHSNIFATRVLGKKTVCIHGRDAAKLFYDESKLHRHGALPRRVVTSLFGKGAVHTLDEAAHRRRKQAFLSVMTPDSMASLVQLTAASWRAAIRSWEQRKEIVLFDEVEMVLTSAICAWAGVPLAPAELPRRARDLVAMVDSFGGVGPRLWQGKLARTRAERWIEDIIERVRSGQLQAGPQTALYVLANHRELDGRPLDARLAAIELLNILRPTVAVSWYIAFSALALHQHPQQRAQIESDLSGEHTDLFMQEVRRFYPFTPYLGARVVQPFEWRGHRFEPGTLVLLDVYGTNHDPALWSDPDVFRPERFRAWDGDAFDFIPQGGGSREHGHRCPGEWITMHNIALALHFLTRGATYQLAPEQDLSFDLSRMPTRPRSGLVLRNVRATPELDREAPSLSSPSASRDSAAASGGVAADATVAHA